MKTLHLSIIILSFILLSVILSQNVAATVPLVEIMLSGTANNQNCENKCVISQTITVQKGSAVEWINNDLVPHTLVSGKPEDNDSGTLFDSGQIWMGKFFIHNFNDVAVYHYFEKDHPENTGTINVTNGTYTSGIESPLKQFNSGVAVENISCKEGLYLAIKLHNEEPTCLKAGTISKLASRGFLYGTNESQTNYTTILIPPGSEDPSSSKTYSPDVATIVLGINNTVTWVNQAEAANTIVPDMPLQQDGKSFGSDVLKPDDSYKFTFTELGTFGYHGEPHPWQRGKIIVLSQPNHMTSAKTSDPFGITALVIYHPFLGCLSSGCPHNNFYLKINSNFIAYLTGYNICNKDSCAKSNDLSVLLPINTILKNPNYASIELPESLKWKYGDTVYIQLEISPNADNKTASLIDLGNSTIVP